MDKPCPVCARSIRSRELAGQPRRRPYRKCPSCGAHITVDPLTKRRQVVALVIGLVALAMTIAATAWGTTWSVLGTVISSVVLFAWIFYSEQRVRFVPYER